MIQNLLMRMMRITAGLTVNLLKRYDNVTQSNSLNTFFFNTRCFVSKTLPFRTLKATLQHTLMSTESRFSEILLSSSGGGG